MRNQVLEKRDFLIQEIEKLKQARLIREVAHPTCIANPVVVPKANSSRCLCVDFTSLNKACPKDPYLLSRIDLIINSTIGCRGDDPRYGQETRKMPGLWLTLCRLTKYGPGWNIRASARPGYKYIPAGVYIYRCNRNTCCGVPAYI
jgi:hypothetical protein